MVLEGKVRVSHHYNKTGGSSPQKLTIAEGIKPLRGIDLNDRTMKLQQSGNEKRMFGKVRRFLLASSSVMCFSLLAEVCFCDTCTYYCRRCISWFLIHRGRHIHGFGTYVAVIENHNSPHRFLRIMLLQLGLSFFRWGRRWWFWKVLGKSIGLHNIIAHCSVKLLLVVGFCGCFAPVLESIQIASLVKRQCLQPHVLPNFVIETVLWAFVSFRGSVVCWLPGLCKQFWYKSPSPVFTCHIQSQRTLLTLSIFLCMLSYVLCQHTIVHPHTCEAFCLMVECGPSYGSVRPSFLGFYLSMFRRLVGSKKIIHENSKQPCLGRLSTMNLPS